MDAEITPPPDESEREAVLAALERLACIDEAPRSAWWRLGVEENLRPAGEEEEA
jgi:hypothetical protein